MLAGLSSITTGGIILAGKELTGPGPDRGVVFQSPSLLPWLTASENVMLGINQVFYTASKDERRQIAEYYLAVVGLGDSMEKRPAEHSQGMRQRVGIARAFALKPQMLLLDEPFGMLDALTRYELQQVLPELWRKEKITALMVTHDVDEAHFLSDRIGLHDGWTKGDNRRHHPCEFPASARTQGDHGARGLRTVARAAHQFPRNPRTRTDSSHRAAQAGRRARRGSLKIHFTQSSQHNQHQ